VSTEIISPLAGKPAPKDILVDIDQLLAACADIRPDVSNRRNAWRPERPATGAFGRGSRRMNADQARRRKPDGRWFPVRRYPHLSDLIRVKKCFFAR
jgi:hypothetical protein